MTAFAYAACTLIWGSTWLAIKFSLDGVPPFLGAGLRFVLAAAVLWTMILVSGKRKPLSARGKKAAWVAAVLQFAWNYALVYWAETRVASVHPEPAAFGLDLERVRPLFAKYVERMRQWTTR